MSEISIAEIKDWLKHPVTEEFIKRVDLLKKDGLSDPNETQIFDKLKQLYEQIDNFIGITNSDKETLKEEIINRMQEYINLLENVNIDK